MTIIHKIQYIEVIISIDKFNTWRKRIYLKFRYYKQGGTYKVYVKYGS